MKGATYGAKGLESTATSSHHLNTSIDHSIMTASSSILELAAGKGSMDITILKYLFTLNDSVNPDSESIFTLQEWGNALEGNHGDILNIAIAAAHDAQDHAHLMELLDSKADEFIQTLPQKTPLAKELLLLQQKFHRTRVKLDYSKAQVEKLDHEKSYTQHVERTFNGLDIIFEEEYEDILPSTLETLDKNLPTPPHKSRSTSPTLDNEDIIFPLEEENENIDAAILERSTEINQYDISDLNNTYDEQISTQDYLSLILQREQITQSSEHINNILRIALKHEKKCISTIEAAQEELHKISAPSHLVAEENKNLFTIIKTFNKVNFNRIETEFKSIKDPTIPNTPPKKLSQTSLGSPTSTTATPPGSLEKPKSSKPTTIENLTDEELREFFIRKEEYYHNLDHLTPEELEKCYNQYNASLRILASKSLVNRNREKTLNLIENNPTPGKIHEHLRTIAGTDLGNISSVLMKNLPDNPKTKDAAENPLLAKTVTIRDNNEKYLTYFQNLFQTNQKHAEAKNSTSTIKASDTIPPINSLDHDQTKHDTTFVTYTLDHNNVLKFNIRTDKRPNTYFGDSQKDHVTAYVALAVSFLNSIPPVAKLDHFPHNLIKRLNLALGEENNAQFIQVPPTNLEGKRRELKKAVKDDLISKNSSSSQTEGEEIVIESDRLVKLHNTREIGELTCKISNRFISIINATQYASLPRLENVGKNNNTDASSENNGYRLPPNESYAINFFTNLDEKSAFNNLTLSPEAIEEREKNIETLDGAKKEKEQKSLSYRKRMNNVLNKHFKSKNPVKKENSSKKASNNTQDEMPFEDIFAHHLSNMFDLNYDGLSDCIKDERNKAGLSTTKRALDAAIETISSSLVQRHFAIIGVVTGNFLNDIKQQDPDFTMKVSQTFLSNLCRQTKFKEMIENKHSDFVTAEKLSQILNERALDATEFYLRVSNNSYKTDEKPNKSMSAASAKEYDIKPPQQSTIGSTADSLEQTDLSQFNFEL